MQGQLLSIGELQVQWKNVISPVRNSRNTCSHTKYLCSSSLGTHLHSEVKDAHSMQFFQSYHKNILLQEKSGGKMYGSRVVRIWLTSLIRKATLFLNDYHMERSRRTCSNVTLLCFFLIVRIEISQFLWEIYSLCPEILKWWVYSGCHGLTEVITGIQELMFIQSTSRWSSLLQGLSNIPIIGCHVHACSFSERSSF
jgi:hypothetical protein